MFFGEEVDGDYGVWRNDLRAAYQTAAQQKRSGPVSAGQGPKFRGFDVDWTEEGPRLSGNQVVISPLEANRLLELWFKAFDEHLEAKRQADDADGGKAWGSSMVLATIDACQGLYGLTICEADIRYLTTELGRKADLFYRFMCHTQAEAGQ
ncbi:hypothetical protein [Tistlia consotensis]|uniref:hypothetical protein n=1 Tax=Tistlia consotensis TaxID=1321365 RepID=UPI001180285D|nr:hypothetical protein [Tistlia consotensis]